jgi:hypothetical protein
MSEEREPRSAWPWIVVVTFAATVLYPLAYGPWLYLRVKYDPSGWLRIAGNDLFVPLGWTADIWPFWFLRWYTNYLTWWSSLAAP